MRSKLDYLNDQLTDTYDEYVEDVEEDTLEEFNQYILEKIQEVTTALNLLALNGFTSSHKFNSSTFRLCEWINWNLAECAMFA